MAIVYRIGIICWLLLALYLPIGIKQWEELQNFFRLQTLHSDIAWMENLDTSASILVAGIVLHLLSTKMLSSILRKKCVGYLNEIVILVLASIWMQYGWDKIHLLQFPPPHDHWVIAEGTDAKVRFWQWLGTREELQMSVGWLEIGLACSLVTIRKRVVNSIGMIAALFLVLLNITLEIGVLTMAIYLLAGHGWREWVLHD